MAKTKTIETAFDELKEVIVALEAPEITLDESLKLYQKGVKLLKYCSDSIDKAEKKIIELKTDNIVDDINADE